MSVRVLHCMQGGLATRKLSVRLSVERVICDKAKESCAHILVPHTIHPSFVTRRMVGGATPST